VGIKTLTMLLIEGVLNAEKGESNADESSKKQRIVNFIDDMEQIINTVILGDTIQWSCPL